MSDEQLALDWLIHGGGGHENGEDGLRALTVSGEDLVEFLAAYSADEQVEIRVQRADKEAAQRAYRCSLDSLDALRAKLRLAVEALRHSIYRNHEFNENCSGCKLAGSICKEED